MAYDPDVYQHVKSLIAEGISDYRIAKLTAIPRATIRNWRLREEAPRSILHRQRATSWKVPDGAAYCYLLGVYLGDGTVCVKPPNSAWLQVVNDRQYTSISDEIMMAMQVTFPDARPRLHPSSTGESDVLCISHPAIPRAFPQCGRGRKHLRGSCSRHGK